MREQRNDYDLILKGGFVIDPHNQIQAVMDVAIKDGRIKAVAKTISGGPGTQEIDVRGSYVTPGLIDLHVHVYPDFDLSLVADGHSFKYGITTLVDAGSAGGLNFPDFKTRFIDRSRTRVLAFLNVVNSGMLDHGQEQELERMDAEFAAKVALDYPGLIVGIKVAHYWTWQEWDDVHPPWANVEAGVRAGELSKLPLMADVWTRPPQRSYSDLILKKLRPGDIHTHIFAQQFPIADQEGRLNPDLLAARERGVLFDVGHGGGSFVYRNVVPAIKQGFLPDIISTDLHVGNVNGLADNLLYTMSKFLNMGLSLDQLIPRVTTAPAQVMGRTDLGTLSVGAEADVAVIDVVQGQFAFPDCSGAKMKGNRQLQCLLTLRKGEVVYDRNALTLPDWEDAPAEYWQIRPAERPK